MTLGEALKLVAWATANFPQLQERDMRPTAELWARMLADVPYQVAEKALMKVLATSPRFPTVAELREAAAELQHGLPMSASEAWEQVVRAMQKYGSYRQEEALASMHPEVATICRRFGWREMCACEDVEILRGQFRRAWEEHREHRREMAVLPGHLRRLVEDTAARMAVGIREPKALPAPGSAEGGRPA